MWKGIRKLKTSLDAIPLDSEVLRTVSYEETLGKVMRVHHALGITRINHISDLDIFRDIPVVSVTRPNVNIYQLSAAQGKGTNHLHATVSALMEAVERHAGETYLFDKTSSVAKMNERFIDPSSFGIKCNNQTTIDWIKGISLKTAKEVYVPASKVVFPYIPSKDAVEISNSTSNGLASGNTFLEATLHGLLEVIERAAIYNFLEGAPVKYLDLESLNVSEKKLIDSIEKTGSRICILDLSECSLLPTVFVSLLSSHPMSPSVMVAGQGCHRDFSVAIRRGITEAVQSHTVSLQGSREDLIRHQSDWNTPENDLTQMWEEARDNAKKVGISGFKPTKKRKLSIEKNVEDICGLLEDSDYKDIIVVDVTNPHIKLPVAAIIVPGMPDSTMYKNEGA